MGLYIYIDRVYGEVSYGFVSYISSHIYLYVCIYVYIHIYVYIYMYTEYIYIYMLCCDFLRSSLF